jgi:hypothetical protein
MLEQNVMNVIVCAMVQFLDGRFLTMLVRQIASIIFMTLGERLILNFLDADNLWHAIVEGGRCHELRSDFVTFGTIQRNGGQLELCVFCRTGWMLAPAWTGEPQILSTTIASNELGAGLLWRAIVTVHAQGVRLGVFVSNEWLLVELVDEFSRHFILQEHMCLREVGSMDLDLLDWVCGCKLPQEGPDRLLEIIFRNMGTHQAHPERIC